MHELPEELPTNDPISEHPFTQEDKLKELLGNTEKPVVNMTGDSDAGSLLPGSETSPLQSSSPNWYEGTPNSNTLPITSPVSPKINPLLSLDNPQSWSGTSADDANQNPNETNPGTCHHDDSSGRTDNKRSDDISFKGSGRCHLCGCGGFIWSISGDMCKNCGHARSHHGL